MRGPRLAALRAKARANPGICPICGDAFNKKMFSQYICRSHYCTTRYTRLYLYDRKELSGLGEEPPSKDVRRFLSQQEPADLLPGTFMETAVYALPPLRPQDRLDVRDFMAGGGNW